MDNRAIQNQGLAIIQWNIIKPTHNFQQMTASMVSTAGRATVKSEIKHNKIQRPEEPVVNRGMYRKQ